jgi:uncharacterized protein YecT (DUF1311 family)
MTMAENAELKINFTDNELKSIATNAMGRASEAKDNAVMRIGLAKTLLKIFVVLVFGVQCSNAKDGIFDRIAYQYPTDCSLSLYSGKDTKCVKLVYQEINERLERVYNNLIKTLPQDNKTKLIKEYSSWLQSKNKQCEQYSGKEIKLKSCHIDATIPKLNELWKLDEEININQFEGKWAGCFRFTSNELKQRYGGSICVAYFLIQQDSNICGTSQEWASGWFYDNRALYRTENGENAYAIKVCNDGGYGDTYINCDNGSWNNPIQTDFSNWTIGNNLGVEIEQHIDTKFLGSKLRTPLLPIEREEVIKENKWLQDCLSYKGE